MKAVVAAFNQEKALVGAFSVITNLRICFGCNFLEHYQGHGDEGAGGGEHGDYWAAAGGAVLYIHRMLILTHMSCAPSHRAARAWNMEPGPSCSTLPLHVMYAAITACILLMPLILSDTKHSLLSELLLCCVVPCPLIFYDILLDILYLV